MSAAAAIATDRAPLLSALDAARDSAAAAIHELGMVLYIGAALISIGVVCLALLGVARGPRTIQARRWLVGGGLLFPVVTLAALFGYALAIGNALQTHPDADALRIRIVAHQYWWEVTYPAADGQPQAVLANEIHIPTGVAVHLELSTRDVIHSLWIPALAGKVDMIPGRTNHLVLKTAQSGVFAGVCAEFCGAQHARMGLDVVAQSAPEFQHWLTGQAAPVVLTDAAPDRTGYELFVRGGCAACHAIRGTAAAGQLGPDLTHVGSRRSLAAGTLTNHIGTMGGWIAGAQDLKPDSLMPNTTTYSGTELRTLSAWLESLQ